LKKGTEDGTIKIYQINIPNEIEYQNETREAKSIFILHIQNWKKEILIKTTPSDSAHQGILL
jgi:hypothetical protein